MRGNQRAGQSGMRLRPIAKQPSGQSQKGNSRVTKAASPPSRHLSLPEVSPRGLLRSVSYFRQEILAWAFSGATVMSLHPCLKSVMPRKNFYLPDRPFVCLPRPGPRNSGHLSARPDPMPRNADHLSASPDPTSRSADLLAARPDPVPGTADPLAARPDLLSIWSDLLKSPAR